MQALKKGEYSGNVTDIKSAAGIITNITSYHQAKFNGVRHYHDHTHISLVLEGGCVESKKECYERPAGKGTFYEAGEAHQIIRVPKYSRHINLEIAPVFYTDYNTNETMLKSAIDNKPEAAFLLINCYHTLRAPNPDTPDDVAMLLLSYIQNKRGSVKKLPQPPWINLIRDYLHQHYNQPVTLNDLALVSGAHPVTISKYFPLFFHCTLSEYLRKLKVEKSLSLIKSSRLSLTEVALACGFYDQSHFTRTFRAQTGVLPTSYQKY